MTTGEFSEVDQASCVHRWRMEAPLDGLVRGMCRLCGATREDPAYPFDREPGQYGRDEKKNQSSGVAARTTGLPVTMVGDYGCEACGERFRSPQARGAHRRYQHGGAENYRVSEVGLPADGGGAPTGDDTGGSAMAAALDELAAVLEETETRYDQDHLEVRADGCERCEKREEATAAVGALTERLASLEAVVERRVEALEMRLMELDGPRLKRQQAEFVDLLLAGARELWASPGTGISEKSDWLLGRIERLLWGERADEVDPFE